MQDLLYLASAALGDEPRIPRSSPERYWAEGDDFKTTYHGIFTLDLAAVYTSTMYLKQSIQQMFTLCKQGQIRWEVAQDLIEQVLNNRVLSHLTRVLEHQSTQAPVAQWLELAQFEALQLIALLLRGSVEQLMSISRTGIQKPILNLLRHPSGSMRLAAIRCLAIFSSLPCAEQCMFKALLDSSQYALQESELDILLISVPAIHAYYVSHKGAQLKILPRFMQLLVSLFSRRNRELSRICLKVLRELTSNSHIQLPSVREGQTISLDALNEAKKHLLCAQFVFELELYHHIARIITSADTETSLDAAIVFCNLHHLVPVAIESFVRMGQVHLVFDVLRIVSYSEPLSNSQKSRMTLALLSLIDKMTEAEPAILEDVRHLPSSKSASSVQGVPLLILLSSSLDHEISSRAKNIIARMSFDFYKGPSMDQLTETIARFLASVVPQDAENIEIEAKFGRFIDKNTDQRLRLPVLTETILEPGNWYRFDACLTQAQHAQFNKELNAKIKPGTEWSYKHNKTVDSILHKGSQGKFRVTQDESRSKVLETMCKSRLGDIAIFMPSGPVDVRISVNLESPATLSQADMSCLASGNIESERMKDRRSYIDGSSAIQYDLTEVTQTARGRSETKLELEMEVQDLRQVLHDPSTFVKQIRTCIKLLR